MFIIRCKNCGAEQHWGAGVTFGQGTVIEMADRAVFCKCGNGVEETNGVVNNVQHYDEGLRLSKGTDLC